ncbi:2Fe-2S ferredoxin-type domain-containing protein [Scheffersomyces amazonensis]|uniref:2Fe-2S ferredoxin-type domain-containing protein n=1 Tax=Scheffersomyces amazonensis TaxID=1078765 RepID=UPI00315DCF9C
MFARGLLRSATLARTIISHQSKIGINSSSSSVIKNHKFIQTIGLRGFQQSSINNHGHLHKPKPGEELHITFITKDGQQHTYEVAEGDNILDIAQAHNLDMEGACGGSCACSTCHVIVDPEFYDEIPEPDDDENDMLDLAFGLTETSRLGCQVHMTKELDGIRVALPAMTRNLQSKDFN